MTAADHSARRQLAERTEEKKQLEEALRERWKDRIDAAYPVALAVLEQNDYPIDLSIVGQKMGRMIHWEDEERWGWPLILNNEGDDAVYLLSDGTFVRCPYGEDIFVEMVGDEIAHPAIANSLERIAQYNGGLSRYKTQQRLTWRQVLFPWWS